jgi:hypothetical protein
MVRVPCHAWRCRIAYAGQGLIFQQFDANFANQRNCTNSENKRLLGEPFQNNGVS